MTDDRVYDGSLVVRIVEYRFQINVVDSSVQREWNKTGIISGDRDKCVKGQRKRQKEVLDRATVVIIRPVKFGTML